MLYSGWNDPSPIQELFTFVGDYIGAAVSFFDERYYQLLLTAVGKEHTFFLGLFGCYFWCATIWAGYKVFSYFLYRARFVISLLLIAYALYIALFNPKYFASAILLLWAVVMWQCYSMSGAQYKPRVIWGVLAVVLWLGSVIGSNWSSVWNEELLYYTCSFLVLMIIAKGPIRSAQEKEFWMEMGLMLVAGMAAHGAASLTSSAFKDHDGKSNSLSNAVYFGTLVSYRPTPLPNFDGQLLDDEFWEKPNFKPPTERNEKITLLIIKIALLPLWMVAAPFLVIGGLSTKIFRRINRTDSSAKSTSRQVKHWISALQFGAFEIACGCDYVLSQALIRLPMERVGWDLFWRGSRTPQGFFKELCKPTPGKTYIFDI